MRLALHICFALTICASLHSNSVAEQKAFTGARIIPIVGDEIENGTLLIDGGKIIALGAVDDVEIGDDVETIDLKGKVVMASLICTHSHIGGVGGADGSGPIQPGVRV